MFNRNLFLENKIKEKFYKLHIVTLCTFIIFIILQFSLVFKDMQELSYLPTSCTFGKIYIFRKNSCKRECNHGCENSNGPMCSDTVRNNNKLDPDLCLSSNNTENCPYIGECSDGYKCCYKHCNTCCSTSSNGNGGYSNHCTPCNCHCVNHVDNNLCHIKCDMLYTLRMYVLYSNFSILYTKNYMSDINTLNLDIEKYENNTLTCFHNKENTKVIFDKEINKVNFSFYGISAMILFILLLIEFYVFISYITLCKNRKFISKKNFVNRSEENFVTKPTSYDPEEHRPKYESESKPESRYYEQEPESRYYEPEYPVAESYVVEDPAYPIAEIETRTESKLKSEYL